jgi:hypothetical protein
MIRINTYPLHRHADLLTTDFSPLATFHPPSMTHQSSPLSGTAWASTFS